MLKLHELSADPGATQTRKRLGRGEGSGRGKTSGHGHKGKQARSGAGKGAAFEGGQMPLIRRLPKFGFSNAKFRVKKGEVTLRQLNKFADGSTVDFAAVHQMGFVGKQIEYVKVLATGELTKKLNVKLSGFTVKARQVIEAAGGTCEMV